jgi:hypothetical protein
VPFNVIRGNSSRKFLITIAEKWQQIRKPIHVLYAGDHDPSGINIERNTLKRLKEFMDKDGVRRRQEITWERLGATSEDLQRFIAQGMTIPAKRSDNNYSAYWSEFRTNHAVEVDAIPSDEIRDRLEKAILERLDAKAWENSQKKETEEKEKLRKLNRFIRGWGLDKAVEILGKDAPKPPKESIWDWLGS